MQCAGVRLTPMATVTVDVNAPVLGLQPGARVELERTPRVNGAIDNGYLSVVKGKRKRTTTSTGGSTDDGQGQGDGEGTGGDAGTSS
jgi:hypothetical protein